MVDHRRIAQIEAYMVVCTDLHECIGPFDLATALKLSTQLSVERKCNFIPVEAKINVEVEEADDGTAWPGQYL